MVPQWVKKSWIYPSLRRTASALEKGLLQMEYALLSRPQRQAELLEQIQTLPRSNGSRYYQSLSIRLGIVSDSFLYENYFPTCQLRYLTPDNWEALLGDLDCLLVTSVWHGLSGEWTGASVPDSPACGRLCALMEAARKRGLPVLFYSKEDPPNFHCFQQYAALADFIYTSAQECVPRYEALFPGVPVDTMRFAVSPTLHNPIGMKPLNQESGVFFAGSWMKKYPKRVQQQGELFDWVRQAGLPLEIADRNYARYSFRYCYPLRYLSSVVSNFSYEQIAGLYKLYAWALNLNSVTDSEDMFSMRVYDALACGSLVLSNESVGMERLFPQVCVIHSYEELRQILEQPTQQLEARRLDGIRQVFRAGTVYEKMGEMLHRAGVIKDSAPCRPVGVVLPEGTAPQERCRKMFEAQTYPNLLLISSPRDTQAIDACDIIAPWGPGRVYGPHYIEDMVNGFKYTDCRYVAKPIPGETGHHYTGRIADGYAAVFWHDCWVEAGGLPFEGPRDMDGGYLSDGENYCIVI